MFQISSSMDQAVKVLGLAVQGLRTNFWGLGCPSYCGDFPISTFILIGLLGWILGFCCGFWAYHFISFPAHPSPPRLDLSVASTRLAGYLNGQGVRPRRRG